MGMLIEGEWVDDDASHRDADGAFLRRASVFDEWVTPDGSSGFAAEPGRYHLFVSAACPWAHRALIVRHLKGLESVISVSFADLPTRRSWAFSEGINRDLQPIEGVFELRRAYVAARSDYTGRVTVPVLWDKQRSTIVNNESSQIMRMLNVAFNAWGDRTVDLYPPDLRDEIERMNARIYSDINIGVYQCGFATSQDAYEQAYAKLFAALDWIEDILEERRYLCGERITEADWRLFTTLIRFDTVYYSHFKCNRQRIGDYHNLANYLRELHQLPGVAALTDFATIKRVYFGMRQINPTGVIPLGPADLNLSGAHDRRRVGLGLAA